MSHGPLWQRTSVDEPAVPIAHADERPPENCRPQVPAAAASIKNGTEPTVDRLATRGIIPV